MPDPDLRRLPDSPPRRLAGCRGCLANLALLGLGVCLALVLGEVLVRWLVGNPPDLLDKSDPVLGQRFRRGVTAERQVDGRRVTITINRDGFNSPDYRPEPPPGTRRLVFLGDSFTGATEVPLAEAFHQVAARRLSAGGPVEAVNFGVSGYNTAQELLLWRTIAREWPARGVVLAVFPGNDVSDNVGSLSGANQPRFRLDPAGALVPEPFTPRWKSNSGWLRRSALYKWQKLVTNRAVAAVVEARDVRPRYRVYQPPPSAAWRQAWAVTETLLLVLRDEISAAGEPLLVVLVPEHIQVDPAAWRDLLQRCPKMAEESWEPDYPMRRLTAFCAREGIPCVDLTEPFRAGGGALYTRLDGHFSQAGHALAGERIAAEVRRLGWLDDGPRSAGR